MSWGGARVGAGRKPKLVSDARKTCSLKAYPDEWELILQFAKIVKHGDKSAAKKIIENLQWIMDNG